MHFLKSILLSCLLSLCFLTGCSDENAAFESFTRELFVSEVSSNTLNLHYTLENPNIYGIDKTPITFGSFDYSAAASSLYVENLSAALNSFSYEHLSLKNQLTYDILSYDLNLSAKLIPYTIYEEPLSPVTGIHAQLPILLAEYPFYNEADVITYLELLKTLPAYFDSLIAFQKQKANAGLFMSDALADEVIRYCEDFADSGTGNYLISSFSERVSELNLTHYETQNQDTVLNLVLPAYKKLAKEIQSLKGSSSNDQGLCYLKNGQEYYKLLVQSSTGSPRTPSELITLIENQIGDDVLSLASLFQKCPSLSVEIPSFSMSSEEMLSSLKANISKAFPACASVNVELKQVPNSMAPYLSPAFYLTPAIDHFEDNVIYLNPSYSTDDLSLFTTLAHEGYPGHLYQTTYFAAQNPDPLRTWLHFPGYTEGWATYAEMCSYYISPLEKPLETVLQKHNSLILGLYARADLGIHYEGWSRSDTLEIFQTYGIDDADVICEIYELIVGDPANYLSYYVGYLEILELKKEFDGSNMEFHKKLLEIGPAPFEVIRKYISS